MRLPSCGYFCSHWCLGSPEVPLLPFFFWGSLMKKPISRRKGTCIIKGLLENLGAVSQYLSVSETLANNHGRGEAVRELHMAEDQVPLLFHKPP